MHRLDFIRASLLAGIGLNLIVPQKLITPSTIAYLTGRKNPYGTYPNAMHVEAYSAYLEMRDCALEQGIAIEIVSSYRSFDRQMRIWNYKFDRYKQQKLTEIEIIKKVSNYSAIPGTSRHHWGTEIDIIDQNSTQRTNGLLNPSNYEKNGAFFKMHKWMQKNAHLFGYYMVYPNVESRTGFRYEPWHYSYSPVSKALLKKFSNLNIYQVIKDENILGYKKIDETCLKSYFQTHLLGINPELLP